MYSKLQKIAYHEAAHAIAFMHVGEPFEFIQIFDVSHACADPETPLGRVRSEFDTDQYYSLWQLFIMLAGPAAEKHMHPSLSWGAIALGGAGNDYKQAWEITTRQLGERIGGRLVDDIVRTTMRQFVRDEWEHIVKLGNALMAAPNNILNYEECLALLGHETEIVSALASRMPQVLSPVSAN